MSAIASGGMLSMASGQLMSRWDEVSQSWRDQKAAKFEEIYIKQWRETMAATIKTIEELDHILGKIHAECE